MSPGSWSEPHPLRWEQIDFFRGRNVTIEHPWQRYVIGIVTLTAEKRLVPRREAAIPANYPTSCGHIQRLSVQRHGQFSQRLGVISAIALDKR